MYLIVQYLQPDLSGIDPDRHDAVRAALELYGPLNRLLTPGELATLTAYVYNDVAGPAEFSANLTDDAYEGMNEADAHIMRLGARIKHIQELARSALYKRVVSLRLTLPFYEPDGDVSWLRELDEEVWREFIWTVLADVVARSTPEPDHLWHEAYVLREGGIDLVVRRTISRQAARPVDSRRSELRRIVGNCATLLLQAQQAG